MQMSEVGDVIASQFSINFVHKKWQQQKRKEKKKKKKKNHISAMRMLDLPYFLSE